MFCYGLCRTLDYICILSLKAVHSILPSLPFSGWDFQCLPLLFPHWCFAMLFLWNFVFVELLHMADLYLFPPVFISFYLISSFLFHLSFVVQNPTWSRLFSRRSLISTILFCKFCLRPSRSNVPKILPFSSPISSKIILLFPYRWTLETSVCRPVHSALTRYM